MCEGDSIMTEKKVHNGNKKLAMSFFYLIPSVALWLLSAELHGYTAHFLGLCNGVLVATSPRLVDPIVHVFHGLVDYLRRRALESPYVASLCAPVSQLRHDVEPFTPGLDLGVAAEDIQAGEGRGSFQSPTVVKKDM